MEASVHMARRTVGVDINDTHVIATQLGFGRNGDVSLEAAGWLERPPHADDQQLAETVRRVFRQAGVTASHACTSMQSHALVLRPFRYAYLTPPELAAALALEAEEALQQPQSGIYMDWHLNTGPQAVNGTVEGVLVAVPKAEVERHLAILAMADVFPTVMDAACMAVCNLYLCLHGRPSAANAICIVAFANQRVDIAVLWDDCTIFPRTVFSPSGNWDQETGYLAESIDDTLKYHQFKLHRPPVDRMVLTGTIPRRDLLIARLREIVPLVSNWNPLSDIQISRESLQSLRTSEAGAMLAPSLGLALRRF